MARVVQERHLGDTRTAIAFALQQKNTAGVLGPVDLTGKTVEFSMFDDDGTAIVSAASITPSDLANGEGEYQPAAGDVDAAGCFYCYVDVIEGGKPDRFPVGERDWQIIIHPN